MVQPLVAPTVRWRRRKVPNVRVTWLGQVMVLLTLIDATLLQQFSLPMGGKVLLTLALVVLPSLALCLWRAGLLPPERFEEDSAPRS